MHQWYSKFAMLLLGLGIAACLPVSANSCIAQDEDSKENAEAEVTNLDDEGGESEKGEDHGDAGHSEEEHGEEGHAEEHGDDHGDHGAHVNPVTGNVSTDSATSWSTQKAVASWIVFGLMLLGLSTFAWKPISQGLEKRETTIADNIANAEKAVASAEAKLAEYQQKLTDANEEAATIVAEARKDAEATGQRMITEAQEEAARQRERAVAEIESAKRAALSELADASTDVAVDLAKRVVGREVNASDHQNLIQDMLSKLPSNN